MMGSLRSFIEEYVKLFQFAAVIITIGLGSHTLIDRFARPAGAVLEFNADGFNVVSGPSHLPFAVQIDRKKFRDDCPLSSFTAEVVTNDGFAHNMVTSSARASGDKSEGFEKFKYFMRFPFPAHAAVGLAVLKGRLVYECPEGRQVIHYPAHDNLTFTVSGKP